MVRQVLNQPRTQPLREMSNDRLSRLSRIADHLLSQRGYLTSGYHTTQLRVGQGVEFFGHREYIPGDDLRHINWRISAKYQTPYVVQYCDDSSTDCIICLDRSASMTVYEADKWNRSLQLTVAFCYLLLHLGNRVSVAVYSEKLDYYFPAGRGSRHFTHILKKLHEIKSVSMGGRSELKTCINRLPKHSVAIVVSDFLSQKESCDALKYFHKRCSETHAIQILSNNELELPDQKEIKLVDIETKASLLIQPDKYIRDMARQNLAQLVEKTASFCSQHHILHSCFTTVASWDNILIKHIQAHRKSNA